jgi:LuxR family maltose regulon positive regulatory protein
METKDPSVSVEPPRLGTKLTAPAAIATQVVRRSLVDLVCSRPEAKLVLLRAPPGFGKTTVMLQCRERMQQESIATAWLNLDAADNDASRFLSALQAAASSITEGDDEKLRYRSATDASTVGDLAMHVIARLADYDGSFTLFLDDFEAIQEPGVVAFVRKLIEHLPRGGQLVIGSRSQPDLRLGRLRARGQLLEIDASRLRFTLEETAEFFKARRNVRLDFEDLSRLHSKSEGWITALSLASVALERSDSPADFITRFSGTEQSVADYLAEDVLARQPDHIRKFLLHTSVLKQLVPSLCDALVPGVDSDRILHKLAAAEVFLIPLESAGTYRYHSLFARFLQDQLLREAPDDVRRLHSAAAAWYEREQRPVPAIDHAIEGGDFDHALALLNRHASTLLAQGRMRILARWFSAFPPQALAEHPALQLVHMWSVCFTRGPREAIDLLERSGLASTNDPSLAPHVRALQPCLLAMMDRYEDAYAVGHKSLDQLPSAVPFADSVLANAMATVVSVMGEHGEARRLIDAARRAQGGNASEFNLMYSEAAEGIIDLQESRLHQATARFRLAVNAVPRRNYSHSNGNAWAGVPYAVTLYENGQLDQAAHLLQIYLPLARDVGLPDLVILGYVTLSRIVFSQGDVEQALQLLTELEYAGHRGQLPRVVAGAKLERSRLQLLQGHHLAAREELDRADDPALWNRVARLRFLANDLDYIELARLRWELHAGDAQAASDRLAHAAQLAKADSRHRRALKLTLLHAAALHRGGSASEAIPVLSDTLASACAEGFVRLVLDEGEIVRPAIHALAATLQSATAMQDDPVFVDYVQRLASALGPPVVIAPSAASPRGSAYREPLTRKEIRVLQLLAEGYSNSAMAEKLFVSDSTVRTHLRNINAKLDAHNRTQAVAMARRSGLIT